MRVHGFLLSTALVLASGCGREPEAPKDGRAAAHSQAELSTDEEQAKLWRQAAEAGATEGMEKLAVKDAAVRGREPVAVPDRKVGADRQPFPDTTENALIVHAAGASNEPWAGPVSVAEEAGEFLTLRLGDDRSVTLQAKVRGAKLRVKERETGQLHFRRGDPFARNDVVALRLDNDDLLYALVGGKGPVRFDVELFGLSAEQVGEPKGNTMAVKLTAGDETYTLNGGERAVLEKAGLTVEVRASVAVQGEAAHLLPGRPYRIDLLGWRTK